MKPDSMGTADEGRVGFRPIAPVAAEIIRSTSKSGRLATEEEIFLDLLHRGLLTGNDDEARRLWELEMKGFAPGNRAPEGEQNFENLPGEDSGPRAGGTVDPEVMEDDDIVEIETEGGERCFFSSRFMSEDYARILLRKGSDPLMIIAEFVRRSSASYPRPVPLDAFRNPPFDLTTEEIQRALGETTTNGAYQDISQTVTSVGTVFLYSSDHLEKAHASMLAEWADVGQADNP